MKNLALIIVLSSSIGAFGQGLPMTEDNHSLTPEGLNPQIETPAYSWQESTSDGSKNGWQSTAPQGPLGGTSGRVIFNRDLEDLQTQ